MATLPDYKLFYSYLDKAVLTSRSFCASGFRVEGFPYLRCDRFFYELGKRAQSIEERVYWVELMRRYDVRMRIKEIQVLPDRSLKSLRAFFGIQAREKICEYLHYYSAQYLEIDRQQPRFYHAVRRAVRIPRGYDIKPHVPLGFLGYPVMAFATREHERVIAHKHKQLVSLLKTYGKSTTYIPHLAQEWTSVQAQDILRDCAGRNPMRVPELQRDRLESLAWAVAPIITVDSRTNDDRIGEIIWRRRRAVVEAASPALYYYGTVTFIHDEPCLQINYAFWFPAAYAHWSPFLTRERLDGLILRVTFGSDGVPLMFDGMNASGASYFCVPRQSRIVPVKKRFFRRPPFIPSWLPEQYPAVPLHIRIGSGSHIVEHVDAQTEKIPGTPYVLRPYKRLEMLPRDDGNLVSVFNHLGMMKGSRGIRQRGRHVTKLSGRDSFTDPNLYERTFGLK